MRCLAVFFIVFIFQSIYSYGQGNSFLTLFENKIQKADRYYQNQFYIEALDIYQRSLKKDTGSLSLKIKIAKCYKALQKYQDATQLYASIIKDSACKADERLNYVQLLILQGHMDQAKQEYLNYYRQIGDERSAKSVQAMEGLKGFYKDHLFYKVVPLSVNTTNEEFCPVYYDEGVVFISDRMDSPYIRKYTSTDGKYFCKAFYKKPGKSNVVNRELKIAGIANGNIGPVDFYKEEKEMVFSYNPEPSAKKKATRLGLYFASKDEKGEWQYTYPFIYNSIEYSITHPSISKDGSVLYFASDMPGGYGGLDIYKCTWEGSKWSAPVNLGNAINTIQDDAYPFLWNDSVLYFASRGRPGLGGFDIYRSILIGKKYGKPQNLGYPINTSSDDFSLALNEEGSSGIFASNRKGTTDLYEFSKIRVTLQVQAIDRKSKSALRGTKLVLIDSEGDQVEAVTDTAGNCSLYLLPGRSYEVIASFPDYKPVMKELAAVVASKDTVIHDTLLFEKAFQSYIKGVAEIDSVRRVSGLLIYILDMAGNTMDSVVTDINGEFSFEGDPGKDYLFYAVRNDLAGAMYVSGNKEKKSSYLYYLKIQLKPKEKKVVQGKIKCTLCIMDQVALEVKSKITGHIQNFSVFPNGMFTFEGYLNEPYVITAISGTRKTIKEIIPQKVSQAEVILKLE